MKGTNMKTYRKRSCILLTGTLLMISILFTGCETNEKVTEYYPITLEQVLSEANERNQSIIEQFKVDSITDYCFDVDMDGFTEDELKELFTPGYMTGVKPEKAKEDIEVLFRILEGSYSGYAYFGGAQTFDQAKTDMLRDIDTFGEKSISTVSFTNLIREHLNFMIDSHFSIGGVPLGFDEAYCWYDRNAVEYYRDSIGYFTMIDDAKWYLPESMIPYLEYTIGKSGEIVYGLFYIGTIAEVDQLPDQITLTRNKKEKDIEIKWEKNIPKGQPNAEYELKNMNGFKTAVIAAFTATQNANAMINDAIGLSKEDYAIVDLRYNAGGLLPDVTMWMYNFSGKEIYPKGSIVAYASVVNDYWQSSLETEILTAYQNFDFIKSNPELFNNIINNESETYNITNVDDGIQRIDFNSQWTQREGKVLFVLSGKENFSAGEYFVEDCRSMENTLVVGSNSSGCLRTGGINGSDVLYLPNSNIGIIYSSLLSLFNSSKDFDQYGILPDIYIGTGDETEAVTKCIGYYQ
jgi:hypothetical protein